MRYHPSWISSKHLLIFCQGLRSLLVIPAWVPKNIHTFLHYLKESKQRPYSDRQDSDNFQSLQGESPSNNMIHKAQIDDCDNYICFLVLVYARII
jgi:hypothetical protein